MLIINADDYGKTRDTSDHIMICYKSGRITSCTAMMFMADSERAAEIARASNLDIGLHLNLSDHFTGNHHNQKLRDVHERVASYMARGTLALSFYNPLMKRDFEYTFKSQYERFVQLYGKPPSHIDGHRHTHLCMNSLIGGLIPRGSKVRRGFHFERGEKSFAKRCYRALVDFYVTRRYVCVDYFFSITPLENRKRLSGILSLARQRNVELMVHPEKERELLFLMSKDYLSLIEGIPLGTYSALQPKGIFANAGGNGQ